MDRFSNSVVSPEHVFIVLEIEILGCIEFQFVQQYKVPALIAIVHLIAIFIGGRAKWEKAGKNDKNYK